MAFKINDIIPLNNSSKRNSFTTYNYKTADADVEAAGYFNDYSTVLLVGDKIEVVYLTGSTPTSIDSVVVTDITAGVVTVSNFAA